MTVELSATEPQGYIQLKLHPGGLDSPRGEDSLRDDVANPRRGLSPSRQAGTLRFLFTGILINYGVAPFMIASSWAFSSCEKGSPIALYGVLGAQLLHSLHEARTVKALQPEHDWHMPQHPFRITPCDYLCRGSQIAMKKFQEAPLVTIALLVLVGWVDVVDRSTDMLLPGQLKACVTVADDNFYATTWNAWGIIHDFFQAVHLRGALLIFVVATLIAQGMLASWSVYIARNVVGIEEAYDPYLEDGEMQAHHLHECYRNIALASASFGGMWLQKIYIEAVERIPAGSPEAWAHISHLQTSVHLRDEMEDPKLKVAIAAAQKRAKDWVLYNSVLQRVLGEAAPALLFATAMFDLSFNRMHAQSMAKTMFTLVASIGTCLVKAVQCFALGSCHSTVVGLVILWFVVVTCVKLFYAFECPEHFFNVVGWYCVSGMARSTDP